MKLSFNLLLASALCYCSVSALSWTLALHTDPLDASAFATKQVATKGLDWQQTYFAECAGKEYQANYRASDGSGRFVIVKVKKTEAGWQLVSMTEGKAEWLKHAAASH